MAGTGPAPNPRSRRQTGTQAHTWTDLPVDGFKGAVPRWPLPAASSRETATWKRIWRTPQAAVWANLGWSSEVALYVRWLSLAESGDLKAGVEARQWSDRLGLNPSAMLKNRWRIRADEVAVKRGAVRSSPLKRLKVADADAVAEA